MPKLKFKRTPEEEADYQALRKARKRKRASDRYHGKRHGDVRRKWASSDEDDASSSVRRSPDLGDDTAMREDEIFREKMFGALGEDERLDGLESHLNGFVHIPDRWKSAAAGSSEEVLYEEDEFLRLDPATLDDDEYAEWVRLGMYRKSHAAENAERLRRKAAAAERRAAEKERHAEARRIEKAAEEERRRKKHEREAARKAQAIEAYHARWRILLDEANRGDASEVLGFDDIPWPIYRAEVGEFTKDTISKFLFAGDRQTQKEVLRETFLRFHPDKFEGRFLRRVRADDQERVRETIGQISRALNECR